MGAATRAGTTAATHAATPAAVTPSIGVAATRPPLYADAAAALELLGSAPLQPTGAVADALAAGRLVRTGSDGALDHLELVLRRGRIDESTRRQVGEGMNGPMFRVQVADPLAPDATPTWVVEKGAGAQAAQEEFGWKLARELGIDHLVAAAIRREDGAARIVFRPGDAVTIAGVSDVARLEQALAKSYLDDAALALSPEQSAQAARLDRQLLQVFDYLLANNDRRGSNALYDRATKLFTFFDSGHAGRGELSVNGGTRLEPALQLFQAGKDGGRVDIDPLVVDYVRRRITPERIAELHREVFHAADMPGPPARSLVRRALHRTCHERCLPRGHRRAPRPPRGHGWLHPSTVHGRRGRRAPTARHRTTQRARPAQRARDVRSVLRRVSPAAPRG